MAAMRWPGPYIVKYAFDMVPEVAIPLWKLRGPPLPGAVFKIGAAATSWSKIYHNGTEWMAR